jgi:quercetin dioxygenase-like cupin family protein
LIAISTCSLLFKTILTTKQIHMKKSIYLLAIAASIAMQSCGNSSGSSTSATDTTATTADSAGTSANSSTETTPGDSTDGKMGATAQTSSTDIKGIVWKELQKLPLAADPSKEESIGVAIIQPSAPAERHSHAENEIGYVLAGESLLEVEGEPSRTIKTGDSFAIPAGKIHRAKPSGSVPFKALVTYIVVKGQPLARPAK